jgi:hypothetical protein
VWLDGTQIMSGASITSSPTIRFGTHGRGLNDPPEEPGIILLECLTYCRSFFRTLNADTGDIQDDKPRVTTTFFDGPQPVTVYDVPLVSGSATTQLYVDAANPTQQDVFTSGGGRGPRMMLSGQHHALPT